MTYSRKLPIALVAKAGEEGRWLCFDTYQMSSGKSEERKGWKVGPRRPRRRYNRNVELLLGILVIAIVIVLLVRLLG